MSSAPFEKNVVPHLHSLTTPPHSLFWNKRNTRITGGKKGEKQLYNLYMFDFFIYMYMKIIYLNIHPFYSPAPFKISGSTPWERLMERE